MGTISYHREQESFDLNRCLESRFEISTVAVGDGQKKYNGIIRTMRIGTTKQNNDMESSS